MSAIQNPSPDIESVLSLTEPSEPLRRFSEQLQRLIDERRLQPLFQPIVSLDNRRIIGYEALIRGEQGRDLYTPAQLFDAARCSQQLAALEFACREVSCRKFVDLKLPGKLFLNMSPLSFTDKHYREGVTREILARVGLAPERVVFELTERQPLDEFGPLRAATDHFRHQGFAVALDDLGAGYAGLRVWSELNPDYVKIDRHFISGIDADPVKREFVRAMLDIAHRIGNRVIAEGIEREEELRTLASLGVDYVQGFLLARPSATPPVNLTQGLSLDGFRVRHHDSFRQTVGDITQYAASIEPSTKTLTVVERFRADPQLTCLPVVQGDRPLGMVSRSELLNIFSHRYSYELHADKPVETFICKRTILVEVGCELKEAGQMVTEDPLQNLSVDLLVSQEGSYAGVVRIGRLLRCITEEKLRLARHSNPLTQLPGNVPLYEWIDHLLLERQLFTVAYCDINQFKPFNDAFGYGMGDDVILMLGELLIRHVDSVRDFVGHVGGDDFVLVFRSSDWRERCERVLSEFSRAASALMPEGQKDYWSLDRVGQRQRFGSLTLAIGCVTPDPRYCKTHHQVAHLLADAKHSAKREGGSVLFESRRRAPASVPASERSIGSALDL
ncbi:bifunctional diguanylate cyclase/phosphodiesterase [Marinimicrobium agarilyticum]|uniref:bifunctional diguanylate cyclase/phosphodiesterase n=1 Tax=Marinimicrobium agarilyticum TaxID=306546 RepID=UPI0009FE9CF2|nr:bifunctional diguanylate cyclase/phosphodiesterase [Marinimicrobium agarilyticum]